MNIVHGRFEWDSEKEKINVRKHGLSFEEILPVFDDPFFFEMYDFNHSDLSEDRFIGVGMLEDVLIVTTCYTERERTRIISSRVATQNEARKYNERKKDFIS